MHISNNILRHYLKNVLFLTGTAYAGKSTMVRMLAERYGLLVCGENYHMAVSDQIADVRYQPNTCYFQTMSGWQEFLNRTPEEYEKWILNGNREIAEFEIAELIRLSAERRKIIVDTNIPLDLLHEIADYRQVAVMLSPQSMSVERFFDRADPEKQFLLRQIELSDDPQKTMENFKNCIAKINSPARYREYENSGFFTLVRQDTDGDTREVTLRKLADHFRLDGSGGGEHND